MSSPRPESQPAQQQTPPGTLGEMDPKPDHGEESYRGSGRLTGKVAVITGGDSGIGRAVAIAFAREGADVLISYLSEHEDAQDTARYVRCDVRDGAAVEAMIDVAEEAFGPLGVFVNNAGITRDATMRKMTEQQFDDIIAIHLKGTDVADAYSDVIDRFLGAEKPMRFVEAEKTGFFKRLFGGK